MELTASLVVNSTDTVTSTSLDQVKVFCNATTSEIANCYGLAFRKQGTYSLAFAMDEDKKKISGTNVRIIVD